MKKVVFILLIIVCLPNVTVAKTADIVQINSDDIVLLEPEFTDFIKKKMPNYLKKMQKLERVKSVRHLQVEFSDFEKFWRIIKSYYSRVDSLKENSADFKQESFGIREQIFKEHSLKSSSAISLILTYKFLKKNIDDSNKEIETIGKDLDVLMSTLKTSTVRAEVGRITGLKSYAGLMLNAIQDLKSKKIDFSAFKKINSKAVSGIEHADHLYQQFLKLALELTGAFNLSTEVDNTLETMSSIWHSIYNYELYVLENKKVTIASLSTTFIVIFILIVIYRAFKLFMNNMISDKGRAYAINALSRYAMTITIFVVFLSGVGLDLSKITLLVSALSVGIGFGLSTMVSNFISGIILLLEGSVRVNDILKLEDGSIVTVEKIGLRKSVLFTEDHLDIVVPNINLVSKNVINLTYMKKPITRNRIGFGVKPTVDFKKLEKVAIESVIRTLGGAGKVVRDQPLLLVSAIETNVIRCELLVSVDNLNNFIPEALFKKNLLTAFIANKLEIF